MKTFKQYITEEIVELSTKSGVKYHVHKDYAKRFQGLVKDLEDSGYKIHSMSSHRPNASVAGTGRRSAHADGMAIDINPGKNPHTHPHHHNYGQTDMPDIITKDRIHKKHGLGWGGEWKTSRDTMHFSAHPREGGAEQWTPPDEMEQPTEPKKQEQPETKVPEKKPESKSTEPVVSKAQPSIETKDDQEKQTITQTPDISPKRWSDVRASAGFSARQSVTSDPELLNLYNKWKEGNMKESIERFIRRKYDR